MYIINSFDVYKFIYLIYIYMDLENNKIQAVVDKTKKSTLKLNYRP